MSGEEELPAFAAFGVWELRVRRCGCVEERRAFGLSEVPPKPLRP